MSPEWTCLTAATGMAAWREGRLTPAREEALLTHVLRCPWCVAHVWADFVEAPEGLSAEMLDELLDLRPEDAGAPGPAELVDTYRESTVAGSSVVLPRGEGALPDDAESPWPHLDPGRGAQIVAVGMALPRVPQPTAVKAYSLYLGAGSPTVERRAQTPARLRVEAQEAGHGVTIEAVGGDVYLDGEALRGEAALLFTHLLQVGPWTYLLERSPRAEQMKCVGLLWFNGQGVELGDAPLRIGRDPRRCGLALRDSAGRSNLEMRPGALDAMDEKARERLTALTFDAMEVSREHAELSPTRAGQVIAALGRSPVYRLRGEELVGVTQGEPPLPLLPGDRLKVGHTLFEYRLR